MTISKPTTGAAGYATNLDQVIDAVNGTGGRTEISSQVTAAINAASGATVCTSSTRPAPPHEGHMIAETDTGIVWVYVSGAWRPLYTLGMVSRAFQSNQTGSGQSFNSGFDQLVSFDLDNYTTPMATKSVSGTGHIWTIVRSGIWAFTTTLRWDTAVTGSIRMAVIRRNGNHMAGYITAQSHSNIAQQSVFVILPVIAGDTIDVIAYQDSGAARTFDPNNAQGWCRFDGVWLGA
jgi:hypothetical protein